MKTPRPRPQHKVIRRYTAQFGTKTDYGFMDNGVTGTLDECGNVMLEVASRGAMRGSAHTKIPLRDLVQLVETLEELEAERRGA